MANNEEIQNVADAINQVGEELGVMNHHTRCEFTGYTFADSMGLMADAIVKIADALEKIANK